MTLATWLASRTIDNADIRAEIWNLGVRHYGAPLEGARQELAAPGLDPARAHLLRACIRQLSRQERLKASFR
ncbi:MAG: hypothetical protein ACOY5Y_15800 [Pseudomonadota bacterium]